MKLSFLYLCYSLDFPFSYVAVSLNLQITTKRQDLVQQLQYVAHAHSVN